MNADEIVRALKECGDCDTCPYYDCWIDEHTGDPADACDEGRLFRDVIALIESLQAQLAEKIHIKLRTDEDMLTPAEAIETINRLRKAYRKTTAQLIESQRREKSAVEDLSTYKDCGFCIHLQDQQYCYKNCQRHVDVDNFRTHPCWQWRGPLKAGDGEA